MEKMMKRGVMILSILSCGIILGITQVQAQTQGPNDCSSFVNLDPNTFPSALENTREKLEREEIVVFTEEDLTVAVKHLQAYCCESGNAGTESCENVDIPPRPVYTDSPYFVDHLMYVGMKKFDGQQEHCDALGISCQPKDLEIDPVEWREEITEIAEDTKGHPPSMILGKFFDKWGYVPSDVGLGVIADDKFPIAYTIMCNEVQNIWSLVSDSASFSSLVSLEGNTVEERCKEIIKRRRTKEKNYVTMLQVVKGRQYLLDNLKAYLNKYFIDTRLIGLMSKYEKLDACFRTVLRKIDKTSCCNT